MYTFQYVIISDVFKIYRQIGTFDSQFFNILESVYSQLQKINTKNQQNCLNFIDK